MNSTRTLKYSGQAEDGWVDGWVSGIHGSWVNGGGPLPPPLDPPLGPHQRYRSPDLPLGPMMANTLPCCARPLTSFRIV